MQDMLATSTWKLKSDSTRILCKVTTLIVGWARWLNPLVVPAFALEYAARGALRYAVNITSACVFVAYVVVVYTWALMGRRTSCI
jgi:hypothetical protein